MQQLSRLAAAAVLVALMFLPAGVVREQTTPGTAPDDH